MINPFGGYKVVVIPDHKQYSRKLSSVRRTFGLSLARNIIRKRFVGWNNLLEDGRTVICENLNTIFMNPRTKRALDLELAQRQRTAM